MKGRKPVPTGLKILRGTIRKHRVNHNEPIPEPAMPDCPEGLSNEAKAVWIILAPELHAQRILTKLDRAILALVCTTEARLTKALGKIEELGEVVRGSNGSAQKNPWLSVAEKAAEQLVRFCVELGMTPSSRSRLRVAPPAKPVDEFEKLMNRKNKKA